MAWNMRALTLYESFFTRDLRVFQNDSGRGSLTEKREKGGERRGDSNQRRKKKKEKKNKEEAK